MRETNRRNVLATWNGRTLLITPDGHRWQHTKVIVVCGNAPEFQK